MIADAFTSWAHAQARRLADGLFAPVVPLLDDLFPVAHPGHADIHIIGGILEQRFARDPRGPAPSVTGIGLTAEAALLSCLGEASEYLSAVGLPLDRQRATKEEPVVALHSNGLGAGRDAAAARLHGTLELVERHEVLDWWLHSGARPAVPGALIDKALPGGPVQAGWHSWFLWLTRTTGVPVVAALSMRPGDARVATGFKAALGPVAAVRGAWLEMRACQLSHLICEARGQPLPETSPVLAAEPCLTARDDGAGAIPGPIASLGQLNTLLGEKGVAVAWRDLTDPELGVPAGQAVSSDLQAPGSDRLVPSLCNGGDRVLPRRPPIY